MNFCSEKPIFKNIDNFNEINMSNHSRITSEFLLPQAIKILSLIRILLSMRKLQWVEWDTEISCKIQFLTKKVHHPLFDNLQKVPLTNAFIHS